MADKKNKKNKGEGSGGAGKLLGVGAVLIVGGVGAFWFLAPDQFESKLAMLRGMIGL